MGLVGGFQVTSGLQYSEGSQAVPSPLPPSLSGHIHDVSSSDVSHLCPDIGIATGAETKESVYHRLTTLKPVSQNYLLLFIS